MRAIITCEKCGHGQKVERPIRSAEVFYAVCHECEGLMRIDVSAKDIATAQGTRRIDPLSVFRKR